MTDAPHGPHDYPNADQLIELNRHYAEGFHEPGLPVSPSRRLAVVACMDSRMDMFQILGISDGEAHVIRNAGGVVTEDVIRSLCLSQRYMGTTEIVLVHHTDCGLHGLDETEFKAQLEAEHGLKPSWALESFADPYDDVLQSIQRLTAAQFILYKDHIRGFVYDVDTGLMHEVVAD